MRSVKRIVKIHKVENYKVYCLFNNGESRIIDFERLFELWQVDESSTEYPLMESKEEFGKIELIDGSLSWSNISIELEDENGEKMQLPYDLDPIVLYEHSVLDESRQLEVGLMIKQARTELGLTQEALASRSGTSKHYISRVENNKTGIELSTLKRIIEGGLGKRMKISIV